MKRLSPIVAAIALLGARAALSGQQPTGELRDGAFRFKSGVELINVTATVSDSQGRFVPDLQMEDFVVYEDGQQQTITHFEAERVPVSLGIVLDTSGSMAGDKIRAARKALDRFLFELLGEQDEIFLYRFSDHPFLIEGWTSDRRRLSQALRRVSPEGGTAMYDAVARAIPLAETGQHRKKALVVISDGNDTSSATAIVQIERIIRESEVLVYAIGIDGESEPTFRRAPMPLPPPRRPFPPIPSPFPPGRGRWPPFEQQSLGAGQIGRFPGNWSNGRVNVMALRDMTDDSGGRTEVIREADDLDPATASIADELSRQYFLGYPAPGHKDGKWHSIRVEVPKGSYRIRARRGYVAN